MEKVKKVLIAEDDAANRFLLEEILKDVPVEIIWATNGKEAVEFYTQQQEIVLVLMDIRMPIWDGYRAAQEILTINKDAKIIAQTAFSTNADKQRLLELGFLDHISKPINLTSFIETLNKWSSSDS